MKLTWGDGRITRGTLWNAPDGDNEVRYLSQNFVERLCAQDGVGTELVREIEGVIFAYLDPADTLNASDFDELRHIKTDHIREEAARLGAEITAIIQEECALRANQLKIKDKEQRIKTLEAENEGLKKQIPPAKSAEEEKDRNHLLEYRTDLTRLIQAVGVEKSKAQTISNIKILGAPKREVVSGDRAYVIVPSTYTFKQKGKTLRETAQMTFVLTKVSSDWKIAAWTWTGPEGVPVK